MKNITLLLILIFVGNASLLGANSSVIPVGNAAWFYDINGGQPAQWSNELSLFNTNNKGHQISVVYSYGGDFELYLGTSDPFQVYFPRANQEAAGIYSKVFGVQQVITVIDGDMNCGEDWCPDFSKLNASDAMAWADKTAALYCSFPQVSGIQIDLEPFIPPYVTNLLIFLEQLANDLRSEDFFCVNSQYPQGRSLGVFLFAEAATQAFYQAIAPNGYAIISGYDLSSAPAGVPSTPVQYGNALVNCINAALSNTNANNTNKFALGIPAASSTHEFLQYKMGNGTVINGYPIWSNTTDSYLAQAYKAMAQTNLENNGSFLGKSLWGFSATMSFPSHSNNLFFPANPFSTNGEEDWLKSNL